MANRSRADSPTKDCTINGCGRPLRARGLCATHYNQAHQPDRHAPSLTACTWCGVPVARPYKSSRRPVCSPACRHALSAQNYHFGVSAGRSQTAETRARQAGASVLEHFDAIEIFVRDEWTCYICHQSVVRDTDCFDPRSPTIDHVIPLSRGGQHTRANVRCCCLSCNSAKQDKVA